MRSASAPHFLLDQVSGALDDGERRARSLGSAVQNAAISSTADLTRRADSGYARLGPSVSDLPVGGLAPVLARTAAVARQTAAEVAEQAAALPGRAEVALSAAGHADRAGLPALPSAPGMLAAAADHAEPGSQQLQSPWLGTLPSAGSGAVAAAAGEAPGGGSGGLAGRADELLEILEDRLIAELERRGGRFAGVF